MNLSRALTLSFWKKFFLWSVVGLIVFTLFGFFGLPYILKYVLITQLTKLLHRETTVEEVHFNPFYLTLQVKGVALKDRNGTDPFVSFEELALDLEATSVWERGPIVRDIVLKAPFLSIIRNEDLSYNFSDLLEEFTAKPASQPEPSQTTEPVRFSLNNIRLENGRIDFDDRPKKVQHTVRDLNVGIPFLSRLPYQVDVYTEPSFAAQINGTPIALGGKTKPFSTTRETSLDVNIKNIELPKYLEYIPADLRFKLSSGSLDTKLALSFTQQSALLRALLVNGSIALNNVVMTDLDDKPVLTLPLLQVPVDTLDVFGRKVNLGAILLQEPKVHLQLDKTGILNVTTLIREQKAERKIETEKKAGEGMEAKPESAAEAPPTIVEIPEIRLTEGKVTFIDETQEKPFQTVLDSFTVVVRQVSTDVTKPITLEVSCKSDVGEVIQQTGTVLREPLKAEGTVSVQQLPINRYASYYAKYLLFDIKDGKVDVSTQFSYAKGPETSPSTTLSGLAVTLNALRLQKRGEKDNFLKVPTFTVKDAAIDVEKQTVTVGEVVTSKGAVQVTREKDGTFSLANLVSATPAPEKKLTDAPIPRKRKKAAKAPQMVVPQGNGVPPWLVQVKKINLDQYAIRFDDKVPPQPVSILVAPFSVSLENFSTEKNSNVKAAVRMTVNKRGTIAIDGPVSLSPLATTLKVNTKGIDVLPFRPYFANKLKVALTSGSVSADGKLSLQSEQENNFKAIYIGQAVVTKFTTIDKATSEDFLKWKSLYVTGVNVSTSPLRVDIHEVTLADFYSRLTINPDTTLNVQGILVDQPQT